MGKRKFKNKVKNLISSFIITIFLLVSAYFGVDYFQEDLVSKNKDISKNETQEVTAQIDYTNSINLQNDKLNIIYFYVGQADSTFVKLNNSTMLIDAGNNEDGKMIVNFLNQNNISKIDYLVATHADEDHIGGIDDILNSVKVNQLLIPTVGSSGSDYKNAIEAAKNNNVEIKNPVRGDKFNLDSANIEIMSALEGEDVSDNDSSIVMQMNYNTTKYLFMGDAEKEVENSRQWQEVDVLKVGHHGSNSSSSEKFLEQINPKYSIIEVGKNNSYNLPSSKALTRLKNINTKILRTDMANGEEAGSFWLTSNGVEIDIKAVNINLDGNQ